MKYSRRKFLSYLALTGTTAGGIWVWTSNAWAFRFLRERIVEVRREILPPDEMPDWKRWPENGITLAWLGHATVLIRFYGVWILTDPALFPRVGLDLRLFTFGIKRWTLPALTPEQLPPIDLVLLSHAHMDHMDLPSLRSMPRGVPLVTARDTSDVLKGTVSMAHEMGWGENKVIQTRAGEVQIRAFEVNHWGARWLKSERRGYNGYVIEREGKKLIFGGDTAMCDHFTSLRGSGPYEAAIMPIGAYDPWIHVHCTPEQAVTMANQAGARYLVPVHHRTFRLSRETLSEPMERLEQALHREPERLALRGVGETFSIL